jgi:hypothetical protein
MMSCNVSVLILWDTNKEPNGAGASFHGRSCVDEEGNSENASVVFVAFALEIVSLCSLTEQEVSWFVDEIFLVALSPFRRLTSGLPTSHYTLLERVYTSYY